jgi:hypothetical protein
LNVKSNKQKNDGVAFAELHLAWMCDKDGDQGEGAMGCHRLGAGMAADRAGQAGYLQHMLL